MAFDPLDDLIDLRDVIEASESGGLASTEAREFIRAMAHDFGIPQNRLDIADWIREIADNESTVIARRYFVEYAQGLAEDIGTLDTNANRWPLYCIDWAYAARDLEQDYSSFTFDGREYLIRST